MGFSEYVKKVLHWNEELKDLLESENVGRNEEIWGKLDNLTEILEGIENPETMSEEELIGLQF